METTSTYASKSATDGRALTFYKEYAKVRLTQKLYIQNLLATNRIILNHNNINSLLLF